MVRFQVAGAEFGRRAVTMISKVPKLDIAMARLVVASGRISPSAAETSGGGVRKVAGQLQEKVASVLFSANMSGAERLLEGLDIDSIEDADELERYAIRYAKMRWHTVALSLRRRAVEIDSTSASRWVAVSRSLLRAGTGGVANDPVAGLVAGPSPQVAEARSALEYAQRLAPDKAYVVHELGKLEFAHGCQNEGLGLLARAVEAEPRLAWWLDLASAYRKPHVADYDRALYAYEQALRLKPSSVNALRGIIITGCRADQNWARLWRSAEIYESGRGKTPRNQRLLAEMRPLFEEGASRSQFSQALVRLEVGRVMGRRLSWPTTSLIAYRLQFSGRIIAGFKLRKELAERTLAWLGTTSAGNTRHRQKVLSSLLYLGRVEQAQDLIDPAPWKPESKLDELRLAKLAADTHLMAGNIDPLVSYCRAREEKLPLPGDARMKSLVEGKRVAIVGPADTGDNLGEMIDEYDVILRPRYLPSSVAEQADRLGSRTDIAYFSGRELGDFLEIASAAVFRGDLQLVVGRGLSFNSFEGEVPEWLRFYKHDYSLCYHGGPMAIVRMVYDVLQFSPSEISIFNIDFYTGQRAFGAGYREGLDSGLGPYSIVNEIVLAHDLLFDFRFLQALIGTGIVNAKGVAGQVLNLTEEQYLLRLQDSPTMHM